MNKTFLLDESNLLIGTNLTHLNFTYIENPFAQYYYLSLIQTFILVFLGELGDQIFILMIILELKSQSPLTLFVSSFLSFSIINIISITIGSSLDILLYQNFIDILAILIFGITGINLFLKWFDYSNKTYEEEIFNCIKDEIANEEFRKNVIRSRFYESSFRSGHFVNINNEDLKQPLIHKPSFELRKTLSSHGSNHNNNNTLLSSSSSNPNLNSLEKKAGLDVTKAPTVVSNVSGNSNSVEVEIVNEPTMIFDAPTVHIPEDFKKIQMQKKNEVIEENNEEEEEENFDNENKKSYFWIFTKTILITVFGDSTQFGVLASSSIYNFNGVVIGSFTAIFFICLIAAYFNDGYVRELKGRNMSIINGFIFICFAMEIYYFVRNFHFKV
jgi:putative Ca2+/H+ antiporter (TMEM165/GDT1 family)